MALTKYTEGDWFGVPLDEGGYALGVAARVNKTGVLFGYFFGPRYEELPDLGDIVVAPEEAVLIGHFGHLGIRRGRWPIIGRCSDWERSDWPIPDLYRHEALTGLTFRIKYSDDDPNIIEEEELVPTGAARSGPKDGLMGAQFVEIKLSMLL